MKSVVYGLRPRRVLGHCESYVLAVAKYFTLLLALPEAVWHGTERHLVSTVLLGFAKPFAPARWHANRVEVDAFIVLVLASRGERFAAQ
jgi:hypothetical protein